MPTKKLQVLGKIKGEDGLSAYEIAVKNGYNGTEQEWLESLKSKQIIIVDIAEMVAKNDYDLYIELTHKALQGEVVLFGYYYRQMVNIVVEPNGFWCASYVNGKKEILYIRLKGYVDDVFTTDIDIISLADFVTNSDRDTFVKKGLTETEETWTEDEKAKARELLGVQKEIVVVDINDMILNQKIDYFAELSKRYADGEIMILGVIEKNSGFVNSVTYHGENACSWSFVSTGWYINDSSTDLESATIVVYAFRLAVGVLYYGKQEYPISQYITGKEADTYLTQKIEEAKEEISNDSLAVIYCTKAVYSTPVNRYNSDAFNPRPPKVNELVIGNNGFLGQCTTIDNDNFIVKGLYSIKGAIGEAGKRGRSIVYSTASTNNSDIEVDSRYTSFYPVPYAGDFVISSNGHLYNCTNIYPNDNFDGSSSNTYVLKYLTSLKGEDGNNGIDGVNGLSAYEIAVNNGFEGTETEWLESLKGENGKDGEYAGQGLSAYEIACENGFEGTESEWLASLKGKNGINGIDGTPLYRHAISFFDSIYDIEIINTNPTPFTADTIIQATKGYISARGGSNERFEYYTDLSYIGYDMDGILMAQFNNGDSMSLDLSNGMTDTVTALTGEGSGTTGTTENPDKMPTIRLVNARKTRTYYEYMESGDEREINEDYPLIFTVEVTSGTLQVGDKLQLCRRKHFTYLKQGKPDKYKLQKFDEHIITEEDLENKFITVRATKEKELLRSACDMVKYPKYIRVRRPIYNEIGEDVDGMFSNAIQFVAYKSNTGGVSIR